MEPKLIPIVTTAAEADAVELVQTYTRRWPAQENVIRDWLIPLGIDTNHGYAKTAIANSEMTKKREALQKRLDNVKRWTDGARKRMHNASKLYRKRCQQTKERADALYRILNDHQREMERQGVEHWLLRKTIKEEKAVADAEIEEYQQRQWKAYHTSNKEFAKCEKYCREQRELLRALEDLQQQEREMYELENHKDQVMTVCKVALANLGMWVRDRYFPADLALMPVGIACSLSFSCRGGSSGNEIESRWNSSHLTTVPSTAIWRRCAQRLPKNSRVYRMDAPSYFVCKGLLSFHF